MDGVSIDQAQNERARSASDLKQAERVESRTLPPCSCPPRDSAHRVSCCPQSPGFFSTNGFLLRASMSGAVFPDPDPGNTSVRLQGSPLRPMKMYCASACCSSSNDPSKLACPFSLGHGETVSYLRLAAG